jgi:hypothetical protein
MINDTGGVAVARKMLDDPREHPGFHRLTNMDRLDLTVEHVVAFETRFRRLFTRDQRLTARKRCDQYKGRPGEGDEHHN